MPPPCRRGPGRKALGRKQEPRRNRPGKSRGRERLWPKLAQVPCVSVHHSGWLARRGPRCECLLGEKCVPQRPHALVSVCTDARPGAKVWALPGPRAPPPPPSRPFLARGLLSQPQTPASGLAGWAGGGHPAVGAGVPWAGRWVSAPFPPCPRALDPWTAGLCAGGWWGVRGGEVGRRAGRKHLAVCSLSFLTPLWRQTGFLPPRGTLAPGAFPLRPSARLSAWHGGRFPS